MIVEPVHNSQCVVDRRWRVSRRQDRLPGLEVHRSRRRYRLGRTPPLRIGRRPHPPHHHLDVLPRGAIPPHTQHRKDFPPPQQIMRVGPHRQRTDIGDDQARQIRRDRLDLHPFHHDRIWRQILDGLHASSRRQVDAPLTKRSLAARPSRSPRIQIGGPSVQKVQLTGPTGPGWGSWPSPCPQRTVRGAFRSNSGARSTHCLHRTRRLLRDADRTRTQDDGPR